MDQTYSEVVDYFNENYAYFCVNVLNLGKPEYTNSVKTAAVAVTVVGYNKFLNFSFLFNKDFLDAFPNTDQKAFVFAHETMHILLSHLKLAGTFVDYPLYKKLAKLYNEGNANRTQVAELMVEQKKMECFNIAADCVINDYLVRDGYDPPDELCRGMKIVGHDCADYTVREVYNELIQKFKQDDTVPLQGKSIDEHDWLFEAAKDAIDAADKLYESMKASGEIPKDMSDMKTLDSGKNYSLTAQDVEQAFIDQHGISLKWMDLLKKIDPDLLKKAGLGPPTKASFHKQRRKLAAFPGVRLPVTRVDKNADGETDKIPSIVLALDTSGSIADLDRKKFITLAKSVPQDRVKLFCITFTTSYSELDLEHIRYASGGTNFSCIQKYITDKVVPVLHHYPKSVIVVTDGYAPFTNPKPTEHEFKSWYWLLTEYHTLTYIDKWGTDWHKQIDEFVKRG